MDNIYHVILDLRLNNDRFDYIDVQTFDSYEEARKAFNTLVTTIRNQTNNPWFDDRTLKSCCILASSHETDDLSCLWHVYNEHTGQYCKISLTKYESKNTKTFKNL